MKYIADFHIHSHFSLATSKELAPESLDLWAALKGIKIVGTGDFTHPGWIKELKEKLEPAEPGLYKLKKSYKDENSKIQHPASNYQLQKTDVRFLLTAEISNIYKKDGKTRKIHNVIFAPDFDAVDRIQHKLSGLGFNITSDGRPIMGMDARDLLELLLTCSPDIFFIPAHIWTPWFSMLGANSGFDSLKECYRDMSDNIFAVETGLSSNPPMNWLCSFLDKYTLVSNSDAHSPEKLGRNANILNTEISYKALIDALKSGNPDECLGTIEMFPQEGKYHYAGHMKCGVCWDPSETDKNKGICPVCGKKITLGVMNRVVTLADRHVPEERKNRLPFYYAITLKEILSEITGVGENSKKITAIYNQILNKLGPELDILLNLPIDIISKSQISQYQISSDILAEAIKRMRNSNVIIKHGFDGQYGQIKVFTESEIKSFGKSKIAFNNSGVEPPPSEVHSPEPVYKAKTPKPKIQVTKPQPPAEQLSTNNDQLKAINHSTGPALVIAGPGTGKTYILTNRIVSLINERNIQPENILAVTFTNKAANEMKERISTLLGDREISSKIHVSTFHAFGLSVLKEHFRLARRKKNFIIIDEKEKYSILEDITGFEKKKVNDICKTISDIKQNKAEVDINLVDIIKKYEASLIEINCFDIDDLLFYPVRIFDASPDTLKQYQEKYKWILIDEYQDINYIQYQLVKMLAPGSEANLFAIGDANQAIYGFRGADVKFIKQFVLDNPKATIYHLKQSYRCTDKILKASQHVITPTSDLRPQTSLSGLSSGIKINIVKNTNEKSEAEFIARTIEKMIGGLRFFSMDSGISDGQQDEGSLTFSDFAILCRLNRQFDSIEKALNDHSIPFQSIGDVPFFKLEPVDSIIDFLKYCINPDNNFIKEKLLNRRIIQRSDPAVDKTKFMDMSVRKTLEYILTLYFRNEKSKDERILKRMLDLSEDFGKDINAFLDYTTLGNSTDAYRHNIENVSLMTLHASKGLEFKCVFIAGCEDGLLPYSIFESQQADVDEEKRLLYVGMTRAKTNLYLTHAEHRYLYGKELKLPKSPFIENIEQELANIQQAEKKKKSKKENNQLDLF